MEIGNQKRPSLYDLQAQKPVPLIPSGCNIGVRERIRYDGSVHTPLDEENVRQAVRQLKQYGVQAIAVCTLFSFLGIRYKVGVICIYRGLFSPCSPQNPFQNSFSPLNRAKEGIHSNSFYIKVFGRLTPEKP